MNKRKLLSILITVLLLGFIWGHSAMSGDTSQEESLLVGRIITPFLEIFVGKGNVTDHLVRKLAHFIEFAALGFALRQLIYAYEKKGIWYLSYIFLCGMAAAVIDEGIQLLSSGRGSKVSDIFLDSCGVLAGLLVAEFIFLVIDKTRAHHAKST